MKKQKIQVQPRENLHLQLRPLELWSWNTPVQRPPSINEFTAPDLGTVQRFFFRQVSWMLGKHRLKNDFQVNLVIVLCSLTNKNILYTLYKQIYVNKNMNISQRHIQSQLQKIKHTKHKNPKKWIQVAHPNRTWIGPACSGERLSDWISQINFGLKFVAIAIY